MTRVTTVAPYNVRYSYFVKQLVCVWYVVKDKHNKSMFCMQRIACD